MNTLEKTLSGWGQYPKMNRLLARPEHLSHLHLSSEHTYTPRGQGRSYGDAALPGPLGIAISTQRLNHFLAFDENTGVLTAESGVTIKEIIETFLPRGWFPLVVPGTQWVSLGGAIASDIHGKNHHHVGSFSQCLESFELLSAENQLHTCSKTENTDLYHATIGGQGLTGLITRVTLQLQAVTSAYLNVAYFQSKNLSALFETMQAQAHAPYHVAWIDGFARGKHLGKGIFMTGAHASSDAFVHPSNHPLTIVPHHSKTVPTFFPSFLLNRFSLQINNQRYYAKHRESVTHCQDYETFFFPLDHLQHWYRFYGKPGFLQYQMMVPTDSAEITIRTILETAQAKHHYPYLAVLKSLGDSLKTPLSFASPGFTLALDFPLSYGSGLLETLIELDAITLCYGGRVYLTKDARLSSHHFCEMYPTHTDFLSTKARIDPLQQFRSHLSHRLGLTP